MHSFIAYATYYYYARQHVMLQRVFATAEASVCLSVRPSVRHTAVLRQNDATEDDEIFTVW